MKARPQLASLCNCYVRMTKDYTCSQSNWLAAALLHEQERWTLRAWGAQLNKPRGVPKGGR